MYFNVFLLLFISAIAAEYIPPGPKYVCPKRQEIIYPCKCTKGTDAGLYIRCEYSSLASLAAAFHNLAQTNSSVEELILSNSYITNLYGKVFYEINPRKLVIENLAIEAIDDNIFLGNIGLLQELHIINSSLSDFPAKSFSVLGSLIRLHIDQHKIEKLEKSIFFNSSVADKLEYFSLTNGLLEEFPVDSFRPLKKLKSLDLHGNQLKALKKNQFQQLRNLELLDISHNSINRLEASHIADLTKLTWCNVSNNQLTELTRGTFARNSVLKVLRMDHNHIRRLDINSFRGMRFLRHMYFNDNNITEIGRDTFGSVKRIGVINLARNSITSIDFQMFAELNFAELIDVSENSITEIQKQSFKNLYLAVINVSHNALSVIENDAFINCVNITVLDLSYNQLEQISKNAFDTTTYAYELQLSYNNISDFTQVRLQNMSGLMILNVSHNYIHSIAKNAFPKLYELHTVDLSHNKLSQIDNTVFQTLFSLRHLNFSNNEMVTIKPSTFGTLPTLLTMDISNNKITDIAKSAFVKLTSLRFLNMDNNQLDHIFIIPISLNDLSLRHNLISNIDEQTWPSMNSLIYLNLEGNRLANNLKKYSFDNLLTLQTLNLNSNGISEVPKDCLERLATLRYLFLENNELSYLEKSAFGKLPVVFELRLFNNSIEMLSKNSFEGLLQLLNLNLSTNAIKTIPPGAFSGLVSLQVLDLSHNIIERIDNKTNSLVEECYSLKKIDLSHNQFSFLTEKTFPSNPYIPYQLSEINLSYNRMPILSRDITIGAKTVKSINVSHNIIQMIRPGVISNLTSLETLDISYNSIQELSENSEKFTFPENFQNLYASHNELVELPPVAFEKGNKLKRVDVERNDLKTIQWSIIKRMKAGAVINLQDNPLHCDCRLRALNHYLKNFKGYDNYYENITCASPDYLHGKLLNVIPDNYLICTTDDNTQMNKMNDYEISPDLKFRQVIYENGQLYVTWFVSAFNEDIADFYLNIRDTNNIAIIEYYLPYDIRNISIPTKDIQSNINTKVDLCIWAKNSKGDLRPFFDSQCVSIPANINEFRGMFTIISPKSMSTSSNENLRKKSIRDSRRSCATKHQFIGFSVLCIILLTTFLN